MIPPDERSRVSKRVLVTGGFGSLGEHAARALIRAGHCVRLFDVPSKPNLRRARKLDPRIEVSWGDILKEETVREAVRGQHVVIHCASMLPPDTDTRPELAEAVNVGGTRTILSVLAQESRHTHVLFPSSVSIYGPGTPGPGGWTPYDPVCPQDNYTRHKAACEELIRASGLQWMILRVGVSLDAYRSKASGEILRRMFEVAPDKRLEYVHPEDVARAMTSAVTCDEAWNQVHCIGGGESCRIRYRDLFDCAFTASGIGRLPDEAFGDGDFYTDWLDTTASQALLRYQTLSFADYRAQCRHALRVQRWLVTPIRPLARWGLLRYSRPWNERRNR